MSEGQISKTLISLTLRSNAMTNPVKFIGAYRKVGDEGKKQDFILTTVRDDYESAFTDLTASYIEIGNIAEAVIYKWDAENGVTISSIFKTGVTERQSGRSVYLLIDLPKLECVTAAILESLNLK